MDIFLNFRNKSYEAHYWQSIDPYLSKIVKTSLILVFNVVPFLPYTNYLLWISGTTPLGTYIQRIILAILLYVLLSLAVIFIYKKRQLLRRHQKATRWGFDIFFNLAAGYYAYQFFDFNKEGANPLTQYLFGWYNCLLAVTILGPISRWYLKFSGYLIFLLRIGIGVYLDDRSTVTLIKVFQMIFLVVLVTYFHERDRRKYFLEKHLLHEETKVYKEIFDLTSDGVVIFGLKDGMMFRNWEDEKYAWWRNTEDCKRNFEKISLRGYKQMAQFPSNKDLELEKLFQAPNQTNFWKFLEHLTKRIISMNLTRSQNSILRSPTSKASVSREVRPGNLVFLSGSVESGPEFSTLNETTYLLEIKILFTYFNEKPALALVLSDVTERNLVTVLQETNNYKNRLLASVSHELRTPLNASISFTQAAIEHPDLSNLPDIKENFLMPALRSNQLLLHLINDILDFSQMSANKLRLVFENKNVANTLEECVNLIRMQATRKGLRILTDFKFEEEVLGALFCTDHNRLKQIVLNLLSNALKFTLEGEILITARFDRISNAPILSQADLIANTNVRTLTEEEEEIRKRESRRSFRDDRRGQKILRVSVRDTGIGISEENKKKLFKAFEKVELGDNISLNSQGVGLGLVISNNLVVMLGSSTENNGIVVDSQENLGSTFSFWILDQQELKEEEEIHSAQKSYDICSEMEEKPHHGDSEERVETLSNLIPVKSINSILLARKNIFFDTPQITNIQSIASPVKLSQILVVDDDVFNISTISMVLQKCGYTCDTAFNGKQAIQKILERQPSNQLSSSKTKQYKLVFMDCNMPIMDGFEATKILKAKMNAGEIEQIPIVACTAFLTEKEKELVRELEIDAYCVKPLNREKIFALVKKYCSS